MASWQGNEALPNLADVAFESSALRKHPTSIKERFATEVTADMYTGNMFRSA